MPCTVAAVVGLRSGGDRLAAQPTRTLSPTTRCSKPLAGLIQVACPVRPRAPRQRAAGPSGMGSRHADARGALLPPEPRSPVPSGTWPRRATAGTRPNPAHHHPQYVANAAMGTDVGHRRRSTGRSRRRAKRGPIDRAEQLAARLPRHAAWKVRRCGRGCSSSPPERVRAARASTRRSTVIPSRQRVQLGNAPSPGGRGWRANCRGPRRAERLGGPCPARPAVGVPASALDGLDVEFPLDGRSSDPDRGQRTPRGCSAFRRPRFPRVRRQPVRARLEIARRYPDVGSGGYSTTGSQQVGRDRCLARASGTQPQRRPDRRADARRTEAAARFAELRRR
jgi:hypothetical protein